MKKRRGIFRLELYFLAIGFCLLIVLGCGKTEDSGKSTTPDDSSSAKKFTSLEFAITVPEDFQSVNSQSSSFGPSMSTAAPSFASEQYIHQTDRVLVTVSARNEPAFIENQSLSRVGNVWSGTLNNIPLNTLLLFSVSAFDDNPPDGVDPNVATFIGTETKMLTESNQSVVVVLRKNGQEHNEFPKVVKIVRPRVVRQNSSVDIGIEFQGSPGEILTYELTSDLNANVAGTFDPTTDTANLETGNRASVFINYTSSDASGDYSHFVKVTNSQNNWSKRGFKMRIADESTSGLTVAFSPDVKYIGISRTIDTGELMVIPEIDADVSSDQLTYSWSYYGEAGNATMGATDNKDLILSNVTDETRGTAVLTVTANYGGTVGSVGTVVSQYIVAEKVQIDENLKASQIVANGTHTCSRLENSSGSLIKCWGSNANGELGVGSQFDNIDTPIVVPDQLSIRHIAAGEEFTCSTFQDGVAKCWGKNDAGQLGLGTVSSTDVNDPTPLSGITDAKEIAAGKNHACVLLDVSKRLKCWGDNTSRKLGISGDDSQHIPTPTDVSVLDDDIKKVDAGENHTCALLENGTVKCWGSNEFGQLGIDPADYTSMGINPADPFTDTPTTVEYLTEITDLALGANHTCAIRGSEGLVLCWGRNDNRQLGVSNSVNTHDRKIVLNVTDAVSISSKGDFTCAILRDRQTMCWGANNVGQLGNGIDDHPMGAEYVPNVFPATQISAGVNHACAISGNGDVKCWGANNKNQLSYTTDNDPSYVAQLVVNKLLDPIDPTAEFFIGTTLMTAPGNQYLLNGWYSDENPTRHRTQEWTLCYRRSTHGASASTFHARCDNKGETMTIIRLVNGSLVGGYASGHWNAATAGHVSTASNSFLFGITAAQYANCTNSTQCIYNHPSYGPAFGSGSGYSLRIYNNMSSLSYNTTSYGYSYSDSWFGSSSGRGINEIEVFYRSY
jgi:alpha-tubulin suppressor-like RCC1 family protein